MSARHKGLLAIAAAALLALGACGSSGDPASDRPATDQTTVAEAPSAPASPGATPVVEVGVPVPDGEIKAIPNPSPLPKPGGGANAAPDANVIVNSYDRTPAAANTFKGWWMFEVQTANDINKDFQKVYWDGQYVCMARAGGIGPDPILTVLDRDLGYDPSGAAGVYASALRSLCVQFNFGWDPNIVHSFGGYNTFFDEEIKRAHTEIVTKAPQQGITITGSISLFSVGLMAKHACHWLSVQNPSIGLRQYLQQNAAILELADPTRHVLQFTQLVVTESVFRICLNDHHRLNLSWY